MSLLWVKDSISNNRQSGGYNTAKWINLFIMLLGSNDGDPDPEFEIELMSRHSILVDSQTITKI